MTEPLAWRGADHTTQVLDAGSATRIPQQTRTARPAAPRRSRPTVLHAAGVLTAPLILAVLAWQRRWLSDDGLIVVRTVRQILAGNGPVFNAGERVEAVTSPVWTWLTAGGAWASGAAPASVVVWGGLVLGPVGLALACDGTRRVLHHSGGRAGGGHEDVGRGGAEKGDAVRAAAGNKGAGHAGARSGGVGKEGAGNRGAGRAGARYEGVGDRSAGRAGSGKASVGNAVAGKERAAPVVLPAGALVVAVLPPFWDFTTSGLETSLVLCWLGLCWWLLAGLLTGPERGRRGPGAVRLAVVLGLGPLVRPELAVATVCFLVAAWTVARPARRTALRLAACAVALPVGYELFRAAYYGKLVPGPAVAKEALSHDVPRGIGYALDLMNTYHLWWAGPLTALALMVGSAGQERGSRERVLTRAALAGGALLTGYVVVLGGDFMHGRMLLPGVFTLLLPAMVVPLPRPGVPARRIEAALLTGLVVWACLCAAVLRPPYGHGYGPGGVTDERAWWTQAVGEAHPLSTESFLRAQRRHNGALYHWWQLHTRTPQRRLLYDRDAAWAVETAPLTPRVAAGVAAVGRNIGGLGALVPLDGLVVDKLGLAYPLAGHLVRTAHGRPGHEKSLAAEWIVADYAAPSAVARGVDPGRTAAARRTLTCAAPADLLAAARAPLDAGRLWRNVTGAWARTQLRVPVDPREAERKFCGLEG
ncbi:MAG TPA: hypothetical protein VIU15_33805 [Streptomyces sp.]